MTSVRDRIGQLKKKRNAIILAHYYQTKEVQSVSDFVGDSLELCKKAKESNSDLIVLCGVTFMAESAKILNPLKRVLIPVKNAGCPMADMIQKQDVERLRQEHPKAAVVTYINSTAEVKAVSDICCTSSNAVRLVGKLKEEEIIFIPDRNLGSYVAKQLPNKRFFFFEGCCPIHDRVTTKQIHKSRCAYPGAELLVHPECRSKVLSEADFVGSTSEIIRYIEQSPGREFVIGTEEGILTKIKENSPNKEIHMAAGNLICPDMKKTSLPDVLYSLERMEHEIFLQYDVMKQAANSLVRMLELS